MVLSRRGFTGIVDALFFILLIGIATAVVAADSEEPEEVRDSCLSDTADAVFQGRISSEGLGIDDYDRNVPVTDLVSVSMARDDGRAEQYLSGILDKAFARPGSYYLEITKDGDVLSVGNPGIERTEGYETDYGTSFGAVLHVLLVSE